MGVLFLGGGGIYLGLGILADQFWTTHISTSGPEWWVWALVALAIVLALNYVGIRIAVGAMLTFAAVSFVPMLILGVVIIAKGGKDGITFSMFDPGQTSWFGVEGGGVLGGVLLGILLFVGFEAAASIGEESEDPHRSIPRAVLFTIAVAGSFFVFMGRPFTDQGGSGFHVHLSVADAEGGNAFAADGAELSGLGMHFVGGVIAHARGLQALLGPTVNAYKRILPDSLAPTHANWGHDNRTAFCRVPNERGSRTRVEIRTGDGSACPHLIIAALLLAGIDGIERELSPPEPVVGGLTKYEGSGGVRAAYSSTRERYVRWTAKIFVGSAGAR